MAGRKTDDDAISSAEFITLRQACGLTQGEAAAYLQAGHTSIQNWEGDRRSVPNAARDALRALDQIIRDRTTEFITPYVGGTPDGARVKLLRYHTQKELRGAPNADLGLPAYNAMLLRVIDGLARLGVEYEIQWEDGIKRIG